MSLTVSSELQSSVSSTKTKQSTATNNKSANRKSTAVSSANLDSYSASQKQSVKQNIDKAMKDGSLTLEPGKKYLGGLIEKKAEYTYICNGRENIRAIKEKFGIKDGAIRKLNPHIRDDYHQPPKGTLIFFYQEDVQLDK